MQQNENFAKQAEQAEAERPEVVAYFDRNYPSTGDAFIWSNYEGSPYEPVMTVSQHERIVGELRADRDSWAEQAEQRLADWDEMRKERDAALARVAKLEHSQSFQRDIDYSVLSEYAYKHRLHFNNLCAVVRSALIALPAQAQHSGPEEFSFEYRHPNGESHTVTVSRDQVINEMPDFLFEALCSKFCNCEPAGETNVVECCCDEYAEEFKLLAAAPGKEVPQAWIDVQAERRRQITAEGWTPEHDDEHADGQMAQAAGCYALHAGGIGTDWPDGRQNGAALFWPWDKDSWKPTTPRRDLVKACALALAEIERLDRAAASQGGPSDA
ncbi:hypothetical protein ACYTSM_06885 [Pseudomonas aeruginosa]|uniref:hypothetical protein n=1 Tax=Pseudomonas aeruginosa TaxID=287 RepID=UPI0021AEE1A8|nr:hypothetical protein [Pseudomonas aeruginosa]MCT5380640.1 hypothetical protein [Pseudomonas aeruginosa]MCV3849159.1 hypothetical protein [Pseudomonas aeruginosa]MCV3855192.1 hypothetical protein [Pseudomonas aeruginosa]